jgi:glucose-1-phosphate cytidylyltransferase
MIKPADVPVFILAGGLGSRLKEQTEFKPKPMLEIGHRPILLHIIRWYGHFGFNKFIVCAGYKSEVIKEYFLNYSSMNSDFTVDLSTGSVSYHGAHHEEYYHVTVASTGELTMTGGRIGRATSKYLGNAEHFAVTYGDGLTNANLRDELDFHVSHGRLGTILAINPPSRFGELVAEGSTIIQFSEKPSLSHSWINGGYFLFRRNFVQYLSTDETLVLEQEPLMRLSAERQLQAFRHDRFWACMDTQRDKEMLEELWNDGRAPWAVPPDADLRKEQC